MSYFIRVALLATLSLISACANSTPPPPAPLSAEQFAAYQLADVTIDTSEAAISWPQAERDFAESKGIRLETSSSTFGQRDDNGSTKEDSAAYTAYDNTIKSEEAKAYYRQRAADALKPRLTEALKPAFTGEKPLNLTVNLKGFIIRSTAAVAFGGDEGVGGTVILSEPDSEEPIATSPQLEFISQNNTAVPSTGGLAGLAIALVASAAINAVSDGLVDSSDHLATNYSQSARKWLQLEPYEFPE